MDYLYKIISGFHYSEKENIFGKGEMLIASTFSFFTMFSALLECPSSFALIFCRFSEIERVKFVAWERVVSKVKKHPLREQPVNSRQILALSKSKALILQIQIKCCQNIKFIFYMVKNIAGKIENTGFQRFLLFPTMFSKEHQKLSLNVKGL